MTFLRLIHIEYQSNFLISVQNKSKPIVVQSHSRSGAMHRQLLTYQDRNKSPQQRVNGNEIDTPARAT